MCLVFCVIGRLFMCLKCVIYSLFICVLIVDRICVFFVGVCSVSICSVEIGSSGWFNVNVMFWVMVIVRCILVNVFGL